MSKLLDRFRYFKQKGDTFADGHGQVMHTNRDWEDSYRQRWQFDKIVRSTHGVNCTGSCSWKIYVKKWSGDVGNPANRLPAHASRFTEP
ncbi:nitrate reductase 2 alpha subunit [Salmonella enterica subsp. enterica serovar Enteritidis str. 648901 39-2]|nr:nitrate reductase 2 alpha subunit [Salmonella enterica subsp. enterica serovar Enteritidis str. 648901 39-2]